MKLYVRLFQLRNGHPHLLLHRGQPFGGRARFNGGNLYRSLELRDANRIVTSLPVQRRPRFGKLALEILKRSRVSSARRKPSRRCRTRIFWRSMTSAKKMALFTR